MTDKAKEARRAYKRRWNAENKEKNKEYQARYWTKKAQQLEAAEKATAAEMEA